MINNRIYRLTKIFILSYIFSFLLISLQPAQAIGGFFLYNTFIHFIFLMVILLTALIIHLAFIKNRFRNIKKISIKPIFFLNLSIFFSIIGFLLILFDRVYLRGIDYSEGVRIARYQWINSIGGNLFGIFGNILISFGYYVVAYLILNFNLIKKKQLFFSYLAIFVSFVGLSLLNGGRSNILILIFYFSTLVFIFYKKIPFKILFINKFSFFIILFLMGAILLVTESSSQLGEYSVRDHYIADVNMLYGKIIDDLPDYGSFNIILYKINYFVVYLLHGIWTSQIATDISTQSPFYVLYPILSTLSSAGLMDPPDINGYFSESGAFISLPGAFFYDYGFGGILIGSIFLGLLLARVFNLLQFEALSDFDLLFSVLVIITILMSPFLVAYGFTTLFFIPIPFIFFAVLSLFSNKTYWILES